MKHHTTTIAKIMVYLMAIVVIIVCAILLPEIAREEAVGKTTPPVVYPFFISAWVLSIPIFAALHQTLKLLEYIDHNKAFSKKSVQALQNIKYCAVIFSVLIAMGAMTVIFLARSVDPTEEVVHIVTLGSIFIFVPTVIATFTAVLQRLLQDTIYKKSENDLTI
jgi:ABC-type polysaccharide transport system permease subunit